MQRYLRLQVIAPAGSVWNGLASCKYLPDVGEVLNPRDPAFGTVEVTQAEQYERRYHGFDGCVTVRPLES